MNTVIDFFFHRHYYDGTKWKLCGVQTVSSYNITSGERRYFQNTCTKCGDMIIKMLDASKSNLYFK